VRIATALRRGEAHMARCCNAQRYVAEGYEIVVDVDLENSLIASARHLDGTDWLASG